MVLMAGRPILFFFFLWLASYKKEGRFGGVLVFFMARIEMVTNRGHMEKDWAIGASYALLAVRWAGAGAWCWSGVREKHY